MNDTDEIIFLTLTLRRRHRKKRNDQNQNLDFGCEIFLPEDNSMVNFARAEGW